MDAVMEAMEGVIFADNIPTAALGDLVQSLYARARRREVARWWWAGGFGSRADPSIRIRVTAPLEAQNSSPRYRRRSSCFHHVFVRMRRMARTAGRHRYRSTKNSGCSVAFSSATSSSGMNGKIGSTSSSCVCRELPVGAWNTLITTKQTLHHHDYSNVVAVVKHSFARLRVTKCYMGRNWKISGLEIDTAPGQLDKY